MKAVDDMFFLSFFLTCRQKTDDRFSHSLSLTRSLSIFRNLSLSLAFSLFHSLALLLSRSRSLCHYNQDGIGGSYRLVQVRKQAMVATTAHLLGACRHTIGNSFLRFMENALEKVPWQGGSTVKSNICEIE